MFQGTSALSLDVKGRINVPARHRELLMATTNGELTLTKHPVGCLLVFPRPAWEQFREKLMTLPMSADGWRRIFIGSAVDVDVDGAGRLSVSPELRAAAGLVKDVLLLGMGQRLELWDVARHAAHEAETMAGEMPDAIKDFVF
ncbi:division/cell wall cluster transcriptional repressor MraZ [Aquabacterium sp.]|uniref:division/cell wall cluster transcriptional repressor MraZ n=1 Tax=Aquabacterium sp. TaxID=1872578 RepID=UPI002B5163E3|nr:division/cell wall cluster transcriptional repressor MraZ [Aquabacterium sp.]HSW07489.1 division/cell wall cluster transcriptional repressor MraZ [Aquabacterium sp.]